MSWRLKVVLNAALAGFLIPVLAISVFSLAVHFGRYLNMNFVFYLCPTALASMALDNASLATAIVAWLMIALSNAVLYAAVASIPVLFVNIWKRN